MGSYIPNTKEEQLAMLRSIGLESFDQLFQQIPSQVLLKDGPDIPSGLSELEVTGKMEELADKNKVFRHIFRGAGAYCHYIPAIVSSVVSKEEFITAYTPYQAEISQGILQSIFEYQTMICQLTGMDASNASVYDGACAAAEAAAMCRERKRSTVYVSAAVNPQVIQVIQTYCFGSGAPMVLVPASQGRTDLQALKDLLEQDPQAACFYVQQPNYYGCLEEASLLGQIVHQAGAKFIMGCNPIALALLKTPGECGADVAVGEGQPLGMPLSFGGPYLGFMAASSAMTRRLPGRIVGQTQDSQGRRAYVLTLQAREQHIRREKASSNICSNQALCAMTAGAYMTAMGPEGMRQAALLCTSNAHYLQKALEACGLVLTYPQEYFHEFVTTGPEGSSSVILNALEQEGILGGLPLSGREILWCATEMNTKEEMDLAARITARALRSMPSFDPSQPLKEVD